VGDVSILALKPLLKDDKENWCPKLKSDILDDNNNKRFSGVHPSAKGHQKIAENITRLIK
jgi:lysophospholipase L1-like esterase